MAESYFIYFLQACFTRYRDHQGVDPNQILTNGYGKIKWHSPATNQSIISSQLNFFTNRVTDWLCGDNEPRKRKRK